MLGVFWVFFFGCSNHYCLLLLNILCRWNLSGSSCATSEGSERSSSLLFDAAFGKSRLAKLTLLALVSAGFLGNCPTKNLLESRGRHRVFLKGVPDESGVADSISSIAFCGRELTGIRRKWIRKTKCILERRLEI